MAWLIPAVGAALFVTIQCFSYVNAYVASQGRMSAVTFGASQLIVVALFYGAWVLPTLLALSTRRSSQWAALVLGGSMVVLNTLGGIVDGLRDGLHLVLLALLGIALPGGVAIAISWHRLRFA